MTFQYCFDGSIKKVNNLSVSSPRTWGCFWTFCRIAGCCRVFPTHVGVFLHEFNTGRPGSGLPHARGGVSIKTDTSYLAQRSSPRTWGCFLEGWGAICACVVFPTHVGVFPRDPLSSFSGARLPHARGGVSSFHSLHFFSGWSSPRTWGCFSDIRPRESNRVVFPTHVGVFLPDTSPYWSCSGSSPRTWGCFSRKA